MVTINLETVTFSLFGILGILPLLLQDCLPFGRTGGFHYLRYDFYGVCVIKGSQ